MMAGDTTDDGEASGRAGGPLVDPLLESFADRYVHPWSRRALGVDDLPFDLSLRIEEAAKLFERGRQCWRTFDMLTNPKRLLTLTAHMSKPRRRRMATVRDFDGKEWRAIVVGRARDIHRLLSAPTNFDPAKPDELNLWRLISLVGRNTPGSVLYASAAMRCANDAAAECYRLSLAVEERARVRYKVDLAALYESDNDAWFDRMRDVFHDLANDVAGSRVHIETCLGTARIALALATAAEDAANLDKAEREYVELWVQHKADMAALRPKKARAPALRGAGSRYFTGPSPEKPRPRKHSPEVAAAVAKNEALFAEKAALYKENIAHRAKQAKQAEGREARDRPKRERVEAVEKLIGAQWVKDCQSTPKSTLKNRYARLQVALSNEKAFASRYKNTLGEPMTEGGIRAVVKRLGLLDLRFAVSNGHGVRNAATRSAQK